MNIEIQEVIKITGELKSIHSQHDSNLYHFILTKTWNKFDLSYHVHSILPFCPCKYHLTVWSIIFKAHVIKLAHNKGQIVVKVLWYDSQIKRDCEKLLHSIQAKPNAKHIKRNQILF